MVPAGNMAKRLSLVNHTAKNNSWTSMFNEIKFREILLPSSGNVNDCNAIKPPLYFENINQSDVIL